MVAIHIEIRTDAADVLVTVNGAQVSGMATPSGFAVDTVVPESEHTRRHSEWRGGYGSVVVAMARTGDVVIGTFTVVGGVA